MNKILLVVYFILFMVLRFGSDVMNYIRVKRRYDRIKKHKKKK